MIAGFTQSQPPEPMSEQRKAALLKLLGDDDERVFPAVRDQLLPHGPSIRDWLEPHTLSEDPVLRRNARAILNFMGRREADQTFLNFCNSHGEEFDVEEGIWKLALTHDPEINTGAYQAMLDSWASDLREMLRLYRRGESILAVINEYLFDQLGFKGNEDNYYEAENSYLHRVIDRRTGNPISLCLIYMLMGKRLSLPINGIGFPGHFLCRYQTSKEEYYLDAFNQGRLLSKRECIRYLKQNGFGVRDEFLVPISPRRILTRICANLHQIYQQTGLLEEADRLQRYLSSLAR